MKANYRKHNDGTHSSSTYHKKDGTNVRAILKEEANKEEDGPWEDIRDVYVPDIEESEAQVAEAMNIKDIVGKTIESTSVNDVSDMTSRIKITFTDGSTIDISSYSVFPGNEEHAAVSALEIEVEPFKDDRPVRAVCQNGLRPQSIPPMKTLVKHVEDSLHLSVRCDGARSRVITAAQAKAVGLGDNTVQEDGHTVHVVKAQYDRIGPGPAERPRAREFHALSQVAATPNPLGFHSCAQWPDGLLSFGNTTRDRHDTRAQAEAVCRLLELNGLGGEKRHFPVKTWVEEITTTQAEQRQVETTEVFLSFGNGVTMSEPEQCENCEQCEDDCECEDCDECGHPDDSMDRCEECEVNLCWQCMEHHECNE